MGGSCALGTSWGPSPVDELRTLLPQAHGRVRPGRRRPKRRCWRARCDVAIVFAIKVEGEGFDSSRPSLPGGQDAVIEAVADGQPEHGRRARDRQPGRDAVAGRRPAPLLQAWYPGQAGGRAIGEVLTGATNPSGRLPITFPQSLDQTPRPQLRRPRARRGARRLRVALRRGRRGRLPLVSPDRCRGALFAFGHGLSVHGCSRTLDFEQARRRRHRHGQRSP